MSIDAEIHILNESKTELAIMVCGDESMANVAKKLYQKRLSFHVLPDNDSNDDRTGNPHEVDHMIVFIKTPFGDLIDQFTQGYLWPNE